MRWARLRTHTRFTLPLPALSRPQPLLKPPRCAVEFSDRLFKAESDADAIVALEVLAEISARLLDWPVPSVSQPPRPTCCVRASALSWPFRSTRSGTKDYVCVQVSAVKAALSPEAAEAGARAVSEVSAQRALKAVQQHVLEKGEQLCFKSTIPTLSKALAKAEDKAGFEALLEAVEPHLLSVCAAKEDSQSEYSMEEQHDCMRCMNLMVRMQGKVDVTAAVEKVNRWVMYVTMYFSLQQVLHYRYHKLGIIIEGATYSQLAASSLAAGNFPQAEEMLEMRDYL